MKVLQYDMTEADFCGVHEHPQKQMEKLGIRYEKSISESIADSWFFLVETIPDNLPKYLIENNHYSGFERTNI